MKLAAKCNFVFLFFHILYDPRTPVSSLILSKQYIDVIKGYSISKINGTTSVLTQINSPLSCVIRCGMTSWCVSVNYNQLNASCELLNFEPYDDDVTVDVGDDWSIIQYHRNKKLLLRAQRDVGVGVEYSWITQGNNSNPEPGCQFLTYNTSWCTSIYRNAGIDNWSEENFAQIKVLLLASNKVQKELTFSGQGTDHMSWFSQSNLIKSPWSTLDQTNPASLLYFSIEGDKSNQRRFFICKNYGGCPIDENYMVVLDGLKKPCLYDQHTYYPKFLFAPNDTCTNFELGFPAYHEADVFAVVGYY